MKNVFKKTFWSTVRSALGPLLFTLAVVVMIVYGLGQAEVSSRAEGLRMLEESLMRAAIKCYAVEGSYPETVRYIENHYGVYIDRSKYAVHYENFASNILPDITVIEIRR